ncbi:MAG: 4-(cytidine 5'-diphospho)-2-C-methyl-D-erythritol kinase [Faecalibacterium sp.]|jgi:4-diphosphocytidyl-2-C-methyl-D-erythritol kinase|nr:4-(cytidine 5'-diphospho)-2-C-methyl-D-erythritol kinase [Faecalibacterium sp.]
MEKVTILAPAKINLALDVTGRLPNGYHALDMVMQALTLCERITLQKADTLSLALPGSDLPGDAHNIAWKAAEAFLRYTKLSTAAALTVEKHTPVQAGMGGGSADAAGVLVGMNELYADILPRKLSQSELLALGADLGADVPFALMGGTCRVQGVGDLLCPLPPLPDCGIVIVMPEYGVSTPAAFAAFDKVEKPYHPDVPALDAALRAGDFAGVCRAAGNALEAVGSGSETQAIKQSLKQAGARAALMTGSGAAVFGLYDTKAAAEHAAETLRRIYRRVYVTAPARGGPVRT